LHPDLEFSPSDLVCDKASPITSSLLVLSHEFVPGFSKSGEMVVQKIDRLAFGPDFELRTSKYVCDKARYYLR